MKPDEIDEVLQATLDDMRLSRGEKRALSAVFADHADDLQRLDFFRHRAFEIARERVSGGESRQVVLWLEEVVKALAAAARNEAPELAEAHFSPGDRCLRRILTLIGQARRSADVCVFSITDDRIARALLDAHERGVRVRVISDDDKAYDLGSDVAQLAAAGVPVRFDSSEHHMHHKFALFDRRVLLTGSYNWTRSAALHNEENIVVSDDARLVASFGAAFERLWDRYR